MDNDVRKLIQFLAEDCGWPLDEDQIDRSAWPVNNSELGLNDDVSVDSVEIYELRPLTTNQPWGVFFLAIKGTSKLSITLLRKLLRGLVKKKRASADTSNLQQWNLEDLMFVCSLDEPENTTRYFAHFKEQEKGLPKLMIGARWEDSQPENEIKAAKLKLKSNLKWPDNENDIDSWRKLWSKAFPIGHREIITTSSNLAKALARYAVIIKQTIPEIHSIELDTGPIHKLHESFKNALIKNLKLLDFADMVAQTITYGLFSARTTGSKLTGIETLSQCIPSTNPFLKDLFAMFSNLSGNTVADLDFDDLAIDDLISMLNQTNIDAVMSDFGNQFQGGREDPVIHFYETFLAEYDRTRRATRGVFYTPKPVVDSIVRSVHNRLISEFNLPLGLADTSTHTINKKVWHKVMILDPAVGTGTFLDSTLSLIHETMLDHWKSLGKNKSEIKLLWNKYVEADLLPRLFGFELMMAPYTIAHLKLGMKLMQTGYTPSSEIRLNIYLTNTLEEPLPLSKWVPSFISKEAQESNYVKTSVPVTVIIGNPPYSGISQNKGDYIVNLLKKELPTFSKSPGYYQIDGKPLNEKKVWLQDDYVKFIRYSQYLIEKTGRGIIGMITNNGFLENPTFRGMRRSLMDSFNRIEIIDLHGDSKKKEKAPDGTKDENVFEISQGVCIFVASKQDNSKGILHTDMFGKRDAKYSLLRSNKIVRSELQPTTPYYFFSDKHHNSDDYYQSLTPVNKLFIQSNSGIISARDGLVIDLDRLKLLSRINKFSNPNFSNEYIQAEMNLKENYSWRVSEARKTLYKVENKDTYLAEILYRPFNKRHIFFHPAVVWRTRENVMSQMEKENLALITTKKTQDEFGALVTNIIAGHKSVAAYDINSFFPLFIYDQGKAKPNLNPNFMLSLSDHLCKSRKIVLDNMNQFARDIFCYIYAILYSNNFRDKYQQDLKMQFPRIPFTNNNELFEKLVKFGHELIGIHIDPDGKIKSDLEINFVGERESKIESVIYSNETIYINKNKTNGLTGVPKEIWNFYVGGWQVCKKWFTDRQTKGGKTPKEGMVLDSILIDEIKGIIYSINRTIAIMEEIDNCIEINGGWPLEGSEEFEVPEERDEGQRGLFEF